MTKEIENNLIEIKNLIYVIRGQKVMLDSDLAMLYQVETKYLNRQVKRNIERFPQDFMFQLSKEEFEFLRCQIVTTKITEETRGGRQYLPYVFTEHGIAMLSGVLKSKCAIEINIQIMRTFVKLRQWAIENKELAERLTELEHYFMRHCEDNKTDLQEIYKVLALLSDRTRPQEIGFKTK